MPKISKRTSRRAQPNPRIHDALGRLASAYPGAHANIVTTDFPRQAFHLEMALSMAGSAGRIADIGGGVGGFSLCCAYLGMDAHLVDDFGDPLDSGLQDQALYLHRTAGVSVHHRDVVEHGLPFPVDSFDVITTFDSIEHWHHSPRQLLHQCVGSLRPGGWLVIGVPNCVNLRKRITVPFGRGSWSAMHDWYERPRFRGHVREPDVRDLRYIASDLGLVNVRIVGRNWQGYLSPRRWVKRSTAVVDRALRWRPSLCSDIYVIGQRPVRLPPSDRSDPPARSTG